MSISRASYRFAIAAALGVGLLTLTSSGGHVSAKPAPRVSPFAQGGPDSFGYKYVDSQEPNGPQFNGLWENIASSGTVVFGANVDDQVSPAIQIGFTFSFYGTDYTSVYISSNGNIHFTSPSASYPGVQCPNPASPNALIAAFWADCHTGPDGDIRYSSNAQRFLVQYTSNEYYPSNNAETFTYQIRLEPSGVIYMIYDEMSNSGNSNNTSIGIENASGNVGLNYCFNGNPNVIANDRVIKFADNTDPTDPTGLQQAADAAGPNKPLGFVSDATAYFFGSGTDVDAGNTIGIRVEILPSNVAFDPVAVTGETASTPIASMVPSGSVAMASYVFDGTPFTSGDYHWRAQTIDNNGGGSGWVIFNSAPIHFTVDLEPPSAPAGPFIPGDGDSAGVPLPGGNVFFTWGPATDVGPPGPISYHFQVSASPGFAVMIADEILTVQERYVFLDVAAFPYFWRVSAVDQAGNEGPSSPPAAFIVKVDDHIDHGAGDCTFSAGGTPGNVLVVFVALAILAALFRKR